MAETDGGRGGSDEGWRIGFIYFLWSFLAACIIILLQSAGSRRPWVIVVFVILGIVAGTTAVFAHGWHKASNSFRSWAKAATILLFLWGSVTFLGYLAWPPKEASKQPYSTVEAQELHISAELYVDSTKKDDTAMRVILENVGPIAISSLRTFIHSDAMTMQLLVPSAATIAPHEKTELASGLFVGKRPNKVNVYLLYENDLREIYFSEYSFLIAKAVAGAQPIMPTYTKEGRGDPLGAENLINSSITILKQNVGSYVFLFPENRPDGSPNQMFFSAGNRAVAINSVSRKAAVWSGLTKIDKFAEADIGKTSGNIHGVGVVWDDSKNLLAIQVDEGPRIYAVKPGRARKPIRLKPQ